MSDYLDKIQTQKKDGTPLATVPFRDSEAREDITTIQNELTTDTTTVEGNPLNFTTLSAQTAKSTILSVAPIQDLHGYDKPWVGGAGKNKLPLTVEGIKSVNPSATWNGNTTVIGGVTFTILADSDNNVIGIKANGTANDDATLIIYGKSTTSADDITFTSEVKASTGYSGSSSTARGIVWGASGGYIDNTDYTVTANSLVYGFGIRVAKNYTANNIIFYPMIRLSTETDPTFAPYSNICLISGRSEIGILGCGKNLNSNTQTGINLELCNVVAGNTYTIAWDEDEQTGYHVLINDVACDNYATRNSAWTILNAPISGTLMINNFANKNQRNYRVYLGSYDSKPDFIPYQQSTDLTISFGQTVYGGQVNVENGVLVVDRAIQNLGDLTWNERSTMTSGVYRMLSSGISSSVKPCSDGSVANIVCSCYNKTSATATYAKVHGISIDNAGSISIYDERYNTIDSPSAFKTAMNGQTLVYELATPITINLTPNTINLLKGVNNISTDGDKITLTYRDGKVATLSDLLDLEKKLSDEEPYGFIEHMSILDPAQRIEYIGKNKNYSPMTINLAGDHLANYNEWYDFPVIKENKPYMIKADGTVDYALDPNDYTKKFDGSASDVANTSYTGGAFAWIPKTYKREFTVGDDRYVYISTKKLSDEYEAIGFIDENGLEHDGAWIPMFYGTEITQDGTVKIMTLATGAPTQNRNTDTQKTYLTNANPDTLFFGGAIVKVLTDIMIMLGKNSDVQAVFGTGNMSGGNGAQYMKDNACIDGGAFYGTTTNNVLNKAFHSLVLLTQNQWQRDPYTLNIQGEYIVSPYYKYDLTGDSYVKTGVFVTPPSSNNWVYPNKSVSVPHWGAEPVGPYSGSTTTGWADGQYTLANQLTDTTVRVVQRFGRCGTGRSGGVRCVALDDAASGTNWTIGASPLLLSKEKTPV